MKAKLVNETVEKSFLWLLDVHKYDINAIENYISQFYVKLLKENNYNKNETQEQIEKILNNILEKLNKRNYKKIINAGPVFKYQKFSEENES